MFCETAGGSKEELGQRALDRCERERGKEGRTARRLLDVALDLPELAEANALEVHDGARRLDDVTLELGADREAVALELFVLDDERLHLALRGRHLVQLAEVELAELLDVDGTAVLVRLVVEARVELVDGRLLRVVERLVQLVDVERLLPLLGVDPHDLGLGHVELARAEESPVSRERERESGSAEPEGRKGGWRGGGEGEGDAQEHGIVVLLRVVEALGGELLLELRARIDERRGSVTARDEREARLAGRVPRGERRRTDLLEDGLVLLGEVARVACHRVL